MRGGRRGGSFDPATLYLLAGALLIAASLWVPWATAARTARVEMRGDRIADLLLRAGRSLPDAPTPADVEHVVARFIALLQADGVFFGDLERVEPPLPDTLLTFTNKHYVYHLARSPLAPDVTAAASDAPLPLEAMSWPLYPAGPGHAVWFHPEDAPRAYTRNLSSGYVGLGAARPRPGSAHRGTGYFDTARSYRSRADERWMSF